MRKIQNGALRMRPENFLCLKSNSTIKQSLCRYNSRRGPVLSQGRIEQTHGSRQSQEQNLPQISRDAVEVKGVPVWRPGEPLHEAVKVKPGFWWRPQDVGDDRTLPWDICWGQLPKENGTSPKERSMLQSTKLEGVGDLKSYLSFFDTRCRATGFGVCPAGFRSCFGSESRGRWILFWLRISSIITLSSLWKGKFYAICWKYAICLLLL